MTATTQQNNNGDPKPADGGPQEVRARRRDRRLADGILSLSGGRQCQMVMVLAVLLYVGTLGHEFSFDDHDVIVRNVIVARGLRGIPLLAITPMRCGSPTGGLDLYRPLPMITHALEREIWGAAAPLAHLVNVLLYAGLCGLILIVLRSALRNSGSGATVALTAAILFTIHPVHTEVVANVKSRDEILCLLGGMAAFFLLLRYADLRRKRLLLLAAAGYGAALLSKETALAYLPLFPVVLVTCRRASWRDALADSAWLVLPVIIYSMARAWVMNTYGGAGGPSWVDNPLILAGAADRIGTSMAVLGRYLRLFIVPYPLVCDYSFNHVPLCPPFAFSALWPAAAYVGLAAGAWWAVCKKHPLGSALLFYLATIGMVSNLFFAIGTIMAERLLFSPSLGLAMLVAAAGERSLHALNRHGRRLAVGVVVCLAVVCCWQTLRRSANWKNNAELFLHDVKYAPESARLNDQAGAILVAQGHAEHALAYLQKAVHNVPSMRRARLNLAVALLATGRYDQAAVQFRTLLVSCTTANERADLHYNLANALQLGGDKSAALRAYNRAVGLRPAFAEAHMNRGVLLLSVGQFKDAVTSFRRAAAAGMDTAELYFNLGCALRLAGDPENAVVALETALMRRPDLLSAYLQLAAVYRQLGRDDDVQRVLQQHRQVAAGNLHTGH